MKSSGFITVSLIILISIGYFGFSSSESNKKKKANVKAIQSLSSDDGFGEGGVKKKKGYKDNNASLWETEGKDNFINHGVDYTTENIGQNLVANEGDIPKDPNTGKPWTEEAMAQFEELRKDMPENELIPRRMTKDEGARKAREAEKWNKARTAVDNGNYTREDLKIHFGYQKKIVEDRLQIIEYMLEAQKEDGEADKDGQFQKLLEFNKDQLKQMELTKRDLDGKL